MSTALRFPLRFDGLGRTVTTTDEVTIWTDRAAVLLATMLGERVGDAAYGTNSGNALFSDTDLIPFLVESAVSEAFTRYLPDLRVVDVLVDPQPDAPSRVAMTLLFTVGTGGPEIVLDTEIRVPGLGVYAVA